MLLEQIGVATITRKPKGEVRMGFVQTERQKIAALGLIMGESWVKKQFKVLDEREADSDDSLSLKNGFE